MPMSTTTIRVTTEARDKLQELAHARGLSMTAFIDAIAEQLVRDAFFDAADRAYAALQADPVASNDYRRELAEWDGVLMDGLEVEADDWSDLLGEAGD